MHERTMTPKNKLNDGTQVLKELENRAELRGIKQLMLETNIDWEDAKAFYLRHGFEELARNEIGIRYQKRLKAL